MKRVRSETCSGPILSDGATGATDGGGNGAGVGWHPVVGGVVICSVVLHGTRSRTGG